MTGKLPADDDGTVGKPFVGEGTAGEGPLLPTGKGAIGLLAVSVAGVEDGRNVHSKNSLFVGLREMQLFHVKHTVGADPWVRSYRTCHQKVSGYGRS